MSEGLTAYSQRPLYPPHPPNGCAGGVEHHRDHIDPGRSRVGVMGSPAETVVLQFGHLGERIDIHPGLDLDRNHSTVDTHEQIDLTATRPDIRGDQSGTPASQEGEGNRLAAGP